MKLESRIGNISHPDEKIYTFLTNFNNFKHLIPEGKIQNWQCDEESCRFSISPIGETGVKIIEKEPYKLIKLSGIDKNSYNLFFWVQIKKVADNHSRIKLTLQAELNPMVQMMAKKPLQEFLDKLVSQMEGFKF